MNEIWNFEYHIMQFLIIREVFLQCILISICKTPAFCLVMYIHRDSLDYC